MYENIKDITRKSGEFGLMIGRLYSKFINKITDFRESYVPYLRRYSKFNYIVFKIIIKQTFLSIIIFIICIVRCTCIRFLPTPHALKL